jgi:hypothetical protein
MADLYLYLGFARRLRFAEGLHPLVMETLIRRPEAVSLGAALPALPAVEPKGASFLRRLFLGKKQRLQWMQNLAPGKKPTADLALAMLEARPNGAGPMMRFALALGSLSHQVLNAQVAIVNDDVSDAERAGIERAQARLWLMEVFNSEAALKHEWGPVRVFEDPSTQRSALEQLNHALSRVHGRGPGLDMIARWLKGLCAEVGPQAERGALPPAGAVGDDSARGRFDDKKFVERVDAAMGRMAFLANQLAPSFLDNEPDEAQIKEALLDGESLKAPGDVDATTLMSGWNEAVGALRVDHMSRGRNPKPAYDEVSGAVLSAPGKDDSPGPTLPPLPDDASGPMQRVPVGAVPPPAPTSTQELSSSEVQAHLSGGGPTPPPVAPTSTQQLDLSQIESEVSTPPAPPASTQEVDGAAVAAEQQAQAAQGGGFAAPAHTQAVSLDQVEEAVAEQGNAPAAPTSTQQVSLDQIETELAQQPSFQAPAATQQVSSLQIEDAVAAKLAAVANPTAPQAPANTQQVSLDQVEEAVAEQQAAPATPPAAPAHTQQVAVGQIEEALAEQVAPATPATPPAAPAHTQQVSAMQIEEAVAEQMGQSAPATPEAATAAAATPAAAAPGDGTPAPADGAPAPTPDQPAGNGAAPDEAAAKPEAAPGEPDAGGA